MNNKNVIEARRNFNRNNAAALSATHHMTLKRAFEGADERAAVYALLATAGVEVPAWMADWEKPVQFVQAVREGIAVDDRVLQQRLVESVGTIAAGLFTPLLLGQPAREWVTALSKQTLRNKEGGEYSAMFGASMMANSAISQVNRRLYGAYLVDLIDYQQFEEYATLVQDRITLAASAIAAHGMRDSATHGTELMEVRVRVRDHGAAGYEGNRLQELREQMYELSKDARKEDALLAAELIAEYTALLASKDMAASQSAYAQDTSDARPNDTGFIQAAIDSFDHLYSLPVKDVMGLEAEMIRALWAGKQLGIPARGRALMDERLCVAWATTMEWADAAEQPTLQKKLAKRASFWEHQLEATVPATNKEGEQYNQNLATYARWAVNHYTRRIWRDIQMLEIAQELYTGKLDGVYDRIKKEEQGLLPASMTRIGTGERLEMGYSIKLPFLGEYGDDQLDPYDTQGNRMIALYSMILADIDATMPELRAMYAEYRALDEAHGVIWALFASDELPIAAPPVYWNQRGAYLTDTDAKEALAVELGEIAESRRAMTASAIADTLEAAMAGVGALI